MNINVNVILEKYLKLPLILKVVIFGILWIIVILVLYTTIINSQFKTIQAKKLQAEKLQKQALKIENVKRKIAQFRKDVQELQKNFKLALKKLPDSREIPKLLLNIAEFGKKNSIDFLFFKPGSEKPQEFYATIPITLKMVGSYHDIGRFFYEIGSMTRIVKIPSISVRKSKKNLLYVDARLETYIFLKEKLNAKKKKKKSKKRRKR